jgi:serine protease Do
MPAARAILGPAVFLAILTPGCDIRSGGSSSDNGNANAKPPAAPTGIPSGATPVASADKLPENPRPEPAREAAPNGAAPLSFAPMVRAANPSVVTITTVGEEVEVSPFLGQARRRQVRGLGSGFVIDKTGLILTNNHVVRGAQSVTVTLPDDREFPGKVLGTDPPTDLAVVRIDTKELHPLPLGDSDAIEVGDWVAAIGNPFGLSHTVSAGIISARGRTQDDVQLDQSGYYDFLQTDASINPGNSGGPLLNLKGEVVGINTAIRGDGAQGIGFAIPINMAKRLLPMILRDGHVTRSALGIHIMDTRQLTGEDRTALGIAPNAVVTGAVIRAVLQGEPADRAGLAAGDIIQAFDGQPIQRAAHLQWLASTAGVGRNVTIRALRGDKSFEVQVTLTALPQEPPAR